LESPVRPLSKKQKKRRSEKREREEKKKTDPRVLREQRTYLKKRMEEPETQDFIEKLQSRHTITTILLKNVSNLLNS
jgi:hypothetical protein